MKESEAMVMKKVIEIDCHLCTNCGRCYNICDKKAISRVSNYSCDKCVKYCTTMDVPCKPTRFVCNEELCDLCGKCIEVCPTGAIRIIEIS